MPKKDDLLNSIDRLDCEAIIDTEIEDWIVTTRKVLIVLDDEDKNAYNRVYQDFLFDLQRLLDAGRITDIDYEETLESL